MPIPAPSSDGPGPVTTGTVEHRTFCRAQLWTGWRSVSSLPCGHAVLVHSRALADELGRRLTSDLRCRFPEAEVILREDDKLGPVCDIVVGGLLWGCVGMPVELDDDQDVVRSHAESLMVQVFEDIFDNLWPDELTDAWPPCPVHAEEPLRPTIVRGRACWVCTRNDALAIPLGSL